MGLGRDGTLHGTYESHSYPLPLDRPVSRKAGKVIIWKKYVIMTWSNTTSLTGFYLVVEYHKRLYDTQPRFYMSVENDYK